MKAMDTTSVLVDHKTATTSVVEYPEKASADHFKYNSEAEASMEPFMEHRTIPSTAFHTYMRAVH